MIEVFGKRVYSTLEEIVDPKHTALLIVDVQNDYCARGGAFDRYDMDLSLTEAMIPNLVRFVDEARGRGLKVIFIEMSTLPNGDNMSPSWLHHLVRDRGEAAKRPRIPPDEIVIEGTWGAQTIDALRRRPEEPLVKKARSNAFCNTNLDQILRSNGIETVIVTGVVTQGCVDSTARDASFRDYYVVILRDCVASPSRELHEAALKIQESRYDVVTSRDVVRAWAGVPIRV